MEIQPIAYIETDFKEKFGVPRQCGMVSGLTGRIVFEPEYRSPDAVRELDKYNYIWILWGFSQAERRQQSKEGAEQWTPMVRPPRLGGNKRVGVFASRSPFRPNSLGLSSVRLLKVEHATPIGPVIYVDGIDMIDKTPVYDIKPYLPDSDSHPDAKSGFSDKYREYKLFVECSEDILAVLPEEKREPLIKTLSYDPRPGYQHDPDREYHMSFAGFDVCFKVRDMTLYVLSIDI